jgi:membrane carboxypeptidase/penicillin-binding protein
MTPSSSTSPSRTRHPVRTALLAIPLFLLAYLCVVAAWSWTALDASLDAYPIASGAALSARQSEMLLKIEDPAFFTHHGLSLADGQGVTTISSAIARDVFLMHGQLPGIQGAMQSFYRGVFNCCKKVDIGRDVMALVLDANVSKERQLALYVNEVYMGTHQGRQVHGLAHAAMAYFGKPLAQLTEREFAGMVGMIKAPNQFHPQKNRRSFDERARRVEAVLAGTCRATGLFDTAFDHCGA